MGKREEYKKELLERAKNGLNEFNIEKVQLSKNDPIIQSAKRLIGGVDPDFVVKQAEDFLNAPPDPNFGYQGRKTRTIIKYVEAPGKFFGIKIGRLRIGMWIENEHF